MVLISVQAPSKIGQINKQALHDNIYSKVYERRKPT